MKTLHDHNLNGNDLSGIDALSAVSGVFSSTLSAAGLVDLVPNHATTGDYVAVTIGKDITATSTKRPKLRIYGSTTDNTKSYVDIGLHYWGWVDFTASVAAPRFICGSGGVSYNGNQNLLIFGATQNTTERGSMIFTASNNSVYGGSVTPNFIFCSVNTTASLASATTINNVTDPTITVYADNAGSDWTRYLKFYHDGTNPRVLSGKGAVLVDKGLVSAVSALTDGSTISTDASLGNVFTVTLGGNRTMAAPTNPVVGQKITYQLKQDATGSRTITWNSIFRFPGGTAPTLTTTASKTDYIGFQYNAVDTKWDCLAVSLNY